jgi:hypothetical protein
MADEANTGTASISGCCINVTTRRWAFCPWDGTKLEDGWAHCPNCGALICGEMNSPLIPSRPYSPSYPWTYPQPWVNPWTQPYITYGNLTDCKIT